MEEIPKNKIETTEKEENAMNDVLKEQEKLNKEILARIEWSPNMGEMDYVEAYEKAKQMESDGWRLPREAELRAALFLDVEGFEKKWYWSGYLDTLGDDGARVEAIHMDPAEKGSGPYRAPSVTETKFPVRFVREKKS